MNWRGHVAAWCLFGGVGLAVLVEDWKPAALGVLLTLGFAASGTRPPSPPQPRG